MTETNREISLQEIGPIIQEAKLVAIKYYNLTGRPLGITGEVAEYEAARLLGLKLSAVRNPGYDATGVDNGKEILYQIKGRMVKDGTNPGQRVGRIKFDHDWDVVLLVLLDEKLEPIEIDEATRANVENALMKPGSKARNEKRRSWSKQV